MENLDRTKKSVDELIFIVGVGRSGTTLLQSMLNAHPNLCSPPESHYIKTILAPREKKEKIEFKELEELKSFIKARSAIRRLNISFNEVIESFQGESITLEQIFKKYLSLYAQKRGKKRIVEKDPSNINHLKIIKKYFPDSYLIHIIRDPRDVILSFTKVKWRKQKNVIKLAISYQNEFLKGRKEGKKLFNEKYIEVYYEDLLLQSETTLKTICEKIKETYHKDMLEYYKTAHSIVTQEEKKWKNNVLKPIIKDNTQKWKREFTKNDILKIENSIYKLITTLPYDLSEYYKKQNIIQRCKGKIQLIFYYIFVRIRDNLLRFK